jgi:hypothetical protein
MLARDTVRKRLAAYPLSMDTGIAQHTMDARRLRTACQKLVMVGQFFVSPAAFLGWQPLEVLKG